ncbi:unnamed protein product [Clonostachys solani]|uniref:Uncharacterized protein n=1 Tax=Clonostachys solani TaxID=160281 RepID=A0A9N9WA04_9HYPO|nr:unnamed protein product [Clonostachys solani]
MRSQLTWRKLNPDSLQELSASEAHQPQFQTLNHVNFSNQRVSLNPTLSLSSPRLPFELRLKMLNEVPSTGRRVFTLPLPIHNDSTTLWLNPESDCLFLCSLILEAWFGPYSLCGPTQEYPLGLNPCHGEGISQEDLNVFKECNTSLQSIWLTHLLSTDSRLLTGASSDPIIWTAMGLNRRIPVFPRCIGFDIYKSGSRPFQPSLKGQQSDITTSGHSSMGGTGEKTRLSQRYQGR